MLLMSFNNEHTLYRLDDVLVVHCEYFVYVSCLYCVDV